MEKSGGGWIRLVVALAVIAIGIVVAWQLGAFQYLSKENFDNLKAWFEGLGPVAPLVFILVWIAACVFFLPGIPVTVVSGWQAFLESGVTVGLTVAPPA